MNFEPADLVFTARPGMLDKLIGRFQRSPGEPVSIAKHVAGVSQYGNNEKAQVIESLAQGTVERGIKAYATMDVSAAVFRNTTLAEPQKRLITIKARTYVGRKYGYLKILAHFLDYQLGGRYFFRKIARSDNYPICSWVWAHAYSTVGYRFLGLDPDVVQPDDIWDEIMTDGWNRWTVVGTV
jgi:hypothetical protein